MFCRFCGTEIPEDSLFCPQCGKSLAVSPVPDNAQTTPPYKTQVFSFPPKTTYDQASLPIVQWLECHQVEVKALRCQADAILLAGTLVPVLERLEVDYEESENPRHYQLGMMIDSRSDFGLFRRKSGAALNKQFDHWRKAHPEYEVSGKLDLPLSLGWCSGSLTLFCYRQHD